MVAMRPKRGQLTHKSVPLSAPSLFDLPCYRHATPRFDGSDYEPAMDDIRLTGQLLRVFSLMSDGAWRTLREIEDATGDPSASISAQLRHLRKDRFGGHLVEKRSRGMRIVGLFEYRLDTPHESPLISRYAP